MVPWKKLSVGLEVLLGRYAAFTVRTPSERAACLGVLEAVRRAELNRVTGGSVLASGTFEDAGGTDELVGLRDRWTGQVVGTARGTPASALMHNRASVATYHLDQLPEALRSRVWIGTRLATLPAYRGGPATLLLLRHMYAEGLQRGGLATLITCEPGLLRTYTSMGFFPVGPVHASPTGGFRVPIALPFHDAAWLQEHSSPLLPMLRAHPGPWPTEGVAWARAFRAQGPIDTGITRVPATSEAHPELCADLSVVGVKQLLGGALRVRCTPGQRIVAAGDGGGSWGWVARGGAVMVHPGGGHHYLARGAVFGPSVAATGGKHPVDVVAGVDTEVVLVSRSAVGRLGRTDRATLRHTLAGVSAAHGYPVGSASAGAPDRSLLPMSRRVSTATVTEATVIAA